MIKIRKKRIIIPFFSLILATILTFFMGCSCFGVNLKEEGYFLISEGDALFLVGLTNKGLEQEILVVPEYINGQKLKYLGADSFTRDRIKKDYNSENVMFNSQKLRRIYIPFEIDLGGGAQHYEGRAYTSVMGLDANYDTAIILHLKRMYWSKIYGDNIKVSANCYFKEFPHVNENVIMYYEPEQVNPANVTYYYNYPTTKNGGIYWIDDYDGELISYIPKNPYRAGYTFGGWYKEPECINKWDFEKDIVPEKEITEDNTYIFKELKLYAKWI
jgi:hypothetical protein